MAIVPRRVLQRLIREIAPFTSLTQRERHAAAINRADDGSISAEWELLVLSGLAKLAVIKHEPEMGRRRPDVLALANASSQVPLFVADVATAYQASDHDRNPIEALQELLRERASKTGLLAHGFHFDVRGEMRGPPGKRRMQLKLPAKRDLRRFFVLRIDPFLKECEHEPTQTRSLVIEEEAIDFTLTFKPHDTMWGFAAPSFTTNYSKTYNPIFNILKRKARQLRHTAFAGPRGVVLCAADADLRSTGGGGGIYGLRAIAEEVFRQNPSLSFILTLWAEDPVFGEGRYRSELHAHPAATYPLDEQAADVLGSLQTSLPLPRNSGTNALNEIRFWRWKRGRYFYGSWQMNGGMVKISVRLLMEYLAGRVQRDEFLARLGGDQGFVSLFEQKIRRGQLLTEVRLEPEPDLDDDWVLFTFGPPDPAMARLKPE